MLCSFLSTSEPYRRADQHLHKHLHTCDSSLSALSPVVRSRLSSERAAPWSVPNPPSPPPSLPLQKKSPSSLLEKPPLHALTLFALNFQGRDEVFRFLPTQKQLVFVPPWAWPFGSEFCWVRQLLSHFAGLDRVELPEVAPTLAHSCHSCPHTASGL